MQFSTKFAALALLFNAALIVAVPLSSSDSVQTRDGEIEARDRRGDCERDCTNAMHVPNSKAWNDCVTRCLSTPPPSPQLGKARPKKA